MKRLLLIATFHIVVALVPAVMLYAYLMECWEQP